MYMALAGAALVFAAVAAVLLHRYPDWGQPVESAAAVAAALLTAVTAVAAAVSAASSNRAALDATAALELHDAPEVSMYIDADEIGSRTRTDQVPRLRISVEPNARPPVQLDAKVTWVTEDGKTHRGRMQDNSSVLELTGCRLIPVDGAYAYQRVTLSELMVEFSDNRKRRWRSTMIPDPDGRILIAPTFQNLQQRLRFLP
jgi:hypothetical protein